MADTNSNTPSTLSTTAQRGQVAVIVLLVMVVLLTIGLSVASRVTQDIFLSQQQTESARVFNAAETGAEDALSQDFSTLSFPYTSGPVSINGSTYNYTITAEQELEQRLQEGETATVVVNNNPVGTLDISWGDPSLAGTCNNASVVVTVFFEEAGLTKTRYYAFSPDGCIRGDEFENAGSGDSEYATSYKLSGLDNSVLFVRIKAVYNGTAVRVIGANLPQQYKVRSQANNDEGTEQRTVEVTRGVSTAPSFMDYSVYTRGTIEKN